MRISVSRCKMESEIGKDLSKTQEYHPYVIQFLLLNANAVSICGPWLCCCRTSNVPAAAEQQLQQG